MKKLRQFFWFLLKSPQRKWIGWQTIWTDIAGVVSLITRSGVIKKKDIIWICVGNKNRSSSLLKYLVKSLADCEENSNLALSVADCNSTDVSDLENEIKKIWKGPLIFTVKDEPFARSVVFNRAVNQANGEIIFVCDADVSLPKNLVPRIRKYVTSKSAWFPICQYQQSEYGKDWKWLTSGTGLFAATSAHLRKTGLYDESIKSWGKEDWDLFFRFYSAEIMPYRSRCIGLLHHWHPSEKPEDYVNMF